MDKKHEELLAFIEQNAVLDETTKQIKFDTLYSLNKAGKLLEWSVIVAVHDFNDEPVFIEPDDYINKTEYEEGYAGVLWTHKGHVDGVINDSDMTKITRGKNPGKQNFTTILTQALFEAKSLYENQVKKKGYTKNIEELEAMKKGITIEKLIESSSRGEKPWRLIAMALHAIVPNEAKNWDKIKYPCKIQPKLDGIMMTLVYHPGLPVYLNLSASTAYSQYEKFIETEYPNGLTMDKFTRKKEDIQSNNHILLDYALVAKEYPGLYLVGELYNKDMKLQEISGICRRRDDEAEHDTLNFCVFDAYYYDRSDEPYSVRYERIKNLYTLLQNKRKEFNINTEYGIRLIEAKNCPNKKSVLKWFDLFVSKKYEGAVVRNDDSVYEAGVIREIRVFHAMKLKNRYDKEWPVVDFKQGLKGKEVGAVIWICAQNDENQQEITHGLLPPLRDRDKFSVTPNLSYDERRAIFALLNSDQKFFKNHIYGKELTVNFSDFSEKLLPAQPKALRFKDTEVQDLLEAKIGGEEVVVSPIDMNNLLPEILSAIKIEAKNSPTARYIATSLMHITKVLSNSDITKEEIKAAYKNNNLKSFYEQYYNTAKIGAPNINKPFLDFVLSQQNLTDKKILHINGQYNEVPTFASDNVTSVYYLHDEDIIFNNKSFDVIIIDYGLQHTKDPDTLIATLAKTLKFNGMLYICDQDKMTDAYEYIYLLTDIIRYFRLGKSLGLTYADCVSEYKKIKYHNFYRSEHIIDLIKKEGLTLVKDTPVSSDKISAINNFYAAFAKK